MGMITGVDFVCVPKRRLQTPPLEFYGEVLGLERSALWQRGDEAAGRRRVRDRQHDDRS